MGGWVGGWMGGMFASNECKRYINSTSVLCDPNECKQCSNNNSVLRVVKCGGHALCQKAPFVALGKV